MGYEHFTDARSRTPSRWRCARATTSCSAATARSRRSGARWSARGDASPRTCTSSTTAISSSRCPPPAIAPQAPRPTRPTPQTPLLVEKEWEQRREGHRRWRRNLRTRARWPTGKSSRSPAAVCLRPEYVRVHVTAFCVCAFKHFDCQFLF